MEKSISTPQVVEEVVFPKRTADTVSGLISHNRNPISESKSQRSTQLNSDKLNLIKKQEN